MQETHVQPLDWEDLPQEARATTTEPVLWSPGARSDGSRPCARQQEGVCVLSRLNCVRLFVTPWTVACQVPLSDRKSVV